MNIGGLRFGPLKEADATRMMREAEAALPTYGHVASTMQPGHDPGSAVRAEGLIVGSGDGDFDLAREALRTWAPQRGIGADIVPAAARLEEGATVLVVLRLGPWRLVAPNRIVAVVDEPRRYAYAYGTLPGHPECGEESFTVEQLEDGSVVATIRVQDRPATLVARATGPAVRLVQAAAIRRYLKAVANHVADHRA